MLFIIISATIVVGLIGVLGAFLVLKFFSKKSHHLMYLVSFAAGSMIAVSFFDLLPEAIIEHGDLMTTMEFLVLGFLLFLLIEKTMILYHCHEADCQLHSSAKLVIFGDFVHNLLDGAAIATAFLAGNFTMGIMTTVAVIIHEIPQEIGDFGVLVQSGYTKAKALSFNLLSAVGAVFGGIIAFYILARFEPLIPYLLAMTAGGFVYIAAADLLPELQKDSGTRLRVALHSFIFVFGILIIWLLGKYVGE